MGEIMKHLALQTVADMLAVRERASPSYTSGGLAYDPVAIWPDGTEALLTDSPDEIEFSSEESD